MVDKNRAQRISDQVQREIGMYLVQDMKDPRMELVSITHVEVSRDLAFAKIYFTVLGEKSAIEKAQDALDNAAGFLRKRLADGMNLRKTPQLRFIYDHSTADAQRLTAKIDAAIAADTAKHQPEDN